ncbi:formate dehydrogenase accessory sulfurtransferase FdhD [Methylophaga sulfidovorans]|uniref:Sulfur carrier protein FdhD n=1 Tax=Methylophaga sulfidovorans TaxID=45496 RepID=A0A1I3UMA5_9GAMM|nr:formate dehydrogenase accessory sulfurtransferase FdhD [Methylophaga sulfidovorans]SFJ84042.1 FdhD protein [Methylophaga sulfidovorans]
MTSVDKTTVDVEVAIHKNESATQYQHDDIAVETPVALVYNTISHAVMMATPADLADFALGFSLTENIVDNADQVSHIHVQSNSNGISVRLMIDDEKFDALRERRRSLVGRTGCGLCGVESLKQAIRPIEPVQSVQVADDVIQIGLNNIKQYQQLQQVTGATHAAAWCDLEGNIVLTREDVGRHNALDKLIGAHVKAGLSPHEGFVLVTSRASYEMVQKAASAGFGCLVAVSAPTSLAIEQAQLARLKLVGFARSGRHVIYHDPFTQHDNEIARRAM